MNKEYKIAQITETELQSITMLEQKLAKDNNKEIILIAYEKSK
jgi:hypothetical protein